MERRWTAWLIVLVPLVLLLTACDWSQGGFDAGHPGYNPVEPALTPSSVKHLTPAWTYADSASANLLVSNGTLYSNERGDLDAPDEARAFRVSDGTVRWTASTPPGSSLAAVGNGIVYYNGGGNTVHARDAASRRGALERAGESTGARRHAHVCHQRVNRHRARTIRNNAMVDALSR